MKIKCVFCGQEHELIHHKKQNLNWCPDMQNCIDAKTGRIINQMPPTKSTWCERDE